MMWSFPTLRLLLVLPAIALLAGALLVLVASPPAQAQPAAAGSAVSAAFTFDATAQAFDSFQASTPAFLNRATMLDYGQGVWLLLARAPPGSSPRLRHR